jgi:hypothetical protein
MRAIALFSTLLFTTLAFGYQDRDWRYRDRDQDRYRGYGDDRYRDRDYGYENGGYGRSMRNNVVGRVITDLDRSRSYRRVSDHDRKHYEKAREELQRFQSNWENGKFDTGRLDKAIDNLKDLAQSDRVDPRERQMFARDIEDLRAFRSNRGYSDGYRNGGGYRNGRWGY